MKNASIRNEIFKKLLTTRPCDAIIRVIKTQAGGDITNIAEERKRASKSQEDMAIAVGLSRAGYANIEAGKRKPSVPVAKKIAAVLGFDWTRFYEEDGEAQDSA